MGAAILIPILTEIGTPILKRVLTESINGSAPAEIAGKVIGDLAARLGVKPTPEAIADAYVKEPDRVASAAKGYEIVSGEEWISYMMEATRSRDSLLKAETGKGFFYDGWRPTMSWVLIALWVINPLFIPLVNAAFKAAVPAMPYEHLLGFTGIWLTIYGGGHTIKSVFGKA